MRSLSKDYRNLDNAKSSLEDLGRYVELLEETVEYRITPLIADLEAEVDDLKQQVKALEESQVTT